MKDNKLKMNISFRYRKLGNEKLLIGEGKCFKINDTTLYLIDNIDGKTLNQILLEYMAEFHIDENEGQKVREMLEKLIQQRIFLYEE